MVCHKRGNGNTAVLVSFKSTGMASSMSISSFTPSSFPPLACSLSWIRPDRCAAHQAGGESDAQDVQKKKYVQRQVEPPQCCWRNTSQQPLACISSSLLPSSPLLRSLLTGSDILHHVPVLTGSQIQPTAAAPCSLVKAPRGTLCVVFHPLAA